MSSPLLPPVMPGGPGLVYLCSDVGGLDDHSLGDDYVVRALQPPLLPRTAGALLRFCVSWCVCQNAYYVDIRVVSCVYVTTVVLLG